RRRAGTTAAPGVVALETRITRLAEEHARARTLAEGLATIPGLAVDLERVETNMVNVDHVATGKSTDELLALLERHGVIASGRPPRHLRLVTNRHHDDATIAEALARIRAALA